LSMSGGVEDKPSESRRLLIPPFLKPPSTSSVEGRERRERRVRIRRVPNVERGTAKVNPQLADELKLGDRVEVVVSGGSSRERRYTFSVVKSDEVPLGEIWCNEDELKAYGVADRTVVTVRSSR